MRRRDRVATGVLVLIAVALLFLIRAGVPREVLIEAASLPRLSRKAPVDLPEIRKRGEIILLAPTNSTTYFLYRGEAMGYEYELLKEFAKEQDLEIRVVRNRNPGELLERLKRGEGDVVAGRLVPNAHDEAGVAFTSAVYETQATLVQQESPPDPENLPRPLRRILRPGSGEAEIEARLITDPSQLSGRTVHLPGRSPYEGLLIELSDSLTGDIEVVELGRNIGSETLMRRVARGEVDLTVAQENVAKLKASYFTNLRVVPTVGPEHPVAWAVREDSPKLLAALNRWIREKRGGSLFRELYRKYFIDRRGFRERVVSRYLTSETGTLSPWDPLLKEHARGIGWDWRLLASLAFQESRFDPSARSWAGAVGLLQLMPATARQFGVSNRRDPEQCVRGGVAFLKWLDELWDERIADPQERRKFILASYNAGPGHVLDAQRLARKYGDDPQSWEDVSFWMLQKSKRKYYTDPVVRHGFVRGLEPVMYVHVVLERFDHYRQFAGA